MNQFELALFGTDSTPGEEVALDIAGPAGALEAVVTASRPGPLSTFKGLAVVCHPHPVHGGTMNNKVVTTLVRSYRDLGIPCIRFNFRGTGKSAGTFDHARGEVDDALAVIAWALGLSPESDVCLAGFSFGSAVAAKASYQCRNLKHLTLVAPPVERYDYDLDGTFPAPLCVVQGGQDELVDVKGVYRWLETIQSPHQLIRFDQASHFFHGALVDFKRELSAAIETQLGQ